MMSSFKMSLIAGFAMISALMPMSAIAEDLSPPNAAPSVFHSNSVDENQSLDESSQGYQDIRTKLSEYGVPEEQVGALIDKLNKGESWDSVKGARPLTKELINETDGSKYLYRFADGSLIVSNIELSSKGVKEVPANNGLRSDLQVQGKKAWVSNCDYVRPRPGLRRASNCKANLNLVFATANFEFSYTYRRGGGGRITWYGNSSYQVPGEVKSAVLKKVGKARVSYNIKYFNHQTKTSHSMWMEVTVGKKGESINWGA